MRVLLMLLAVVGLLAGCSKEPPPYESRYTPPEPPPAPVLVAVIGDSYTRGTEMGGAGDHNWTKLAAAQLNKQGIPARLNVKADRGSGYVTKGSKGTSFPDQVPAAVKPNDRVVLVVGSLNDASVPEAELSAAVSVTVNKIRQIAPNAHIVLVGPPWAPPEAAERVARMDAVLQSEAEGNGVGFVNPEGWLGADLISPDGVHPTDAGHKVMADKLAAVITEQLHAA